MKKYNKPELITIEVEFTTNLLGASRVQTGGTLGNEYNSTDISYTKQNGNVGVWGDDNDE